MESHIEKLLTLLPDDKRKPKITAWCKNKDNQTFIPHLVRAIEAHIEAGKDKKTALNVVKTTRAAYTTNSIIGALLLNKTILMVIPTNKIFQKTIITALEKYTDMTGDYSKIVRSIPNNQDGCSIVQQKCEDNERLKELPYIKGGECDKCEISHYDIFSQTLPVSTTEKCLTQTMLKERKSREKNNLRYRPDIISITYAKSETLHYDTMKNDLFRELVQSADVILFDELGQFLLKSSKSVSIFDETTTQKYHIETVTRSLKDKTNEIEKFIDSNLKEGDSKDAGNIIKEAIIKYIYPIIKNENKLMISDYPERYFNPLCFDFCHIDVGGTYDVGVTYAVAKKMDAIRSEYNEIIRQMEYLIVDDKGLEHAEFLIDILQILKNDYIIGYDYEVQKRTKKNGYTKKYSRRIGEDTDNESKLSVIEDLISPHHSVIFTDATMPTLDFTKLKRTIKFYYFGDPGKINEKLAIVQDDSIKKFNIFDFSSDKYYRKKIIGRLQEYIDIFGSEKIVIWTLSKKIHDTLLAKIENSISSNEADENDTSLIIGYHDSSQSRGVESNRRIGIMLGTPFKPNYTFKYLSFVNLGLYDYIPEHQMSSIAIKNDMTAEFFNTSVEALTKSYSIKGSNIPIKLPKIPTTHNQYYTTYDRNIWKDKICQSGWQSGSRAKDPKAIENSLLICLGWETEYVFNMLYQGSNIQYDGMLKFLDSQVYKIPPPHFIKSSDFNRMNKWFKDDEIEDDEIILLGDYFGTSLYQLISNRESKEATLEDVWNKVDGVNDESNDYTNGYYMGLIEISKDVLKSNYGILIKNSRGRYWKPIGFYLDLREKELEMKILTPVQFNALLILEKLFDSTLSQFTESDIRYRDGIDLTDDKVIEVLHYIHDEDVLKHSSWNTEIVKKTGNPKIVKARPPQHN